MSTENRFQNGDWVIFRKQKHSASPGPRAQQTLPAEKGESYNYLVNKFWIVVEVLEDGNVRLKTRRGKEHVVPSTDPQLRRASWFERILHRSRFRAVEQNGSAAEPVGE